MNLRFFHFFPIPLGVFLVAAQGYCKEEIDDRISVLESDMAQIRAKTAFGNHGARTASAAPQTNGCGVFLTADFLWWKLYEGGTEYVIKDKIPFDPESVKGPVKHLNFEWEPGYKVGIGYLFDHDDWDLYLNFTSFQTHAHASTSSQTNALIPLEGIENVISSKAKTHWNVDFDDLDFVLGRNYFVSQYLALHPYFGLTSAWIHQHRRARFDSLPNSVLKLRSKNNFWGIGPRLGVDSQFYLGQNFSLYGNIAGSLLWGRFHVKEREDSPTTELYDLSYNLHRMVSTVGFGLGIAYETNLAHDATHFMIKVGYEGQYWWRQNQLPTFNIFSFEFARQSEDLQMQGLTVDFRFDF